tara:strand:- start:1632 stop:1790 length:159 start_codon:yes stop_codon:yes gene_type:complete
MLLRWFKVGTSLVGNLIFSALLEQRKLLERFRHDSPKEKTQVNGHKVSSMQH